MASKGGAFSMGVEEVVSEAHDCGEEAFVDPGEDAVAWPESDPLSPEPDAFSAFRHFARLFWNQTCENKEYNKKVNIIAIQYYTVVYH